MSIDDMTIVTKEDANNYCRILRMLEMEEEGDPVLEIERILLENSKLKSAITKTINDNLHLADGDVCTLLDLKIAVNFDETHNARISTSPIGRVCLIACSATRTRGQSTHAYPRVLPSREARRYNKIYTPK